MSEHEHVWYEMRVFRFCRVCNHLERRVEGKWMDANEHWFNNIQRSKHVPIVSVEKLPGFKTDQPQQLALF